MPVTSSTPGTGIDRHSGRVISGWDHVVQSLEVIFTTRFGERVMRRWFGSFVPNLLGQNMVPSTVLKFWTAICIAIELWEPRYRITRITPIGDPDQMRTGGLGFQIEGVYMPRGHLGDPTPERDIRALRIGASRDGLKVVRS